MCVCVCVCARARARLHVCKACSYGRMGVGKEGVGGVAGGGGGGGGYAQSFDLTKRRN